MHFLNTLSEKIYNINVTQHMISATKVITRSQHANTTHIACPISYTLVCCICSQTLCMFACSCFTVQRQTLYCLQCVLKAYKLIKVCSHMLSKHGIPCFFCLQVEACCECAITFVPKIIGGVTNLVTKSKMILYKPYHVSIVS